MKDVKDEKQNPGIDCRLISGQVLEHQGTCESEVTMNFKYTYFTIFTETPETWELASL